MTTPSKKRRADDVSETGDFAMQSPTRQRAKTVRPKRRGDAQQADPTTFHNGRLSLRQQYMEQLNAEFQAWVAKALEEAHRQRDGRKPPASQQPPTYARQMMEYAHAADKINSLYNRPHGQVVTWGSDEMEQLGFSEDRPPENFDKVVVRTGFVRGTDNVTQISLGAAFNAAITYNGQVKTWGSNDEGALGRETTMGGSETIPALVKGFVPSAYGPVSVQGGRNEDGTMIRVATGETHAIILSLSGNVYFTGCYSDSHTKSTKVRDERPPDDHTQDIARTEKVDEDGESKMVVTDKDIRGRHFSPTHVYQLEKKVKWIAAGGEFNAAVYEDGELVTWGLGFSGEMARSAGMTNQDEKGDYDLYSLIPQKPHKPDEKEYKGDRAKFLADLEQYETDIGKYEEGWSVVKEHFLKPKPALWAGPPIKKTVLSVACGAIHIVVVARPQGEFDTRVYSSGHNAYGQLGHGDEQARHELTPVVALDHKSIMKVACGDFHTLCLDVMKVHLYAFGRSDSGQLGHKDGEIGAGEFETLPQLVQFPREEGMNEFPMLSDMCCGEFHSCAVTETGECYSWGFGVSLATGHPTDEDTKRPKKVTKIAKLGQVHMVSGGSQHTAVILTKHVK